MAAELIRFTKRSIGGLPAAPAGKRVYYRDEEGRSLQLQVTAAGSKTFQVYRWVRGRPERFTIGKFPDMTIELARREADRINGKLADHERPENLRRSKRGEWTLEALLSDFLTHKRNRRGAPLTDATKRGYQGIFKSYLSRLAVRKVSDVTREDVEALHRRIGKEAPYAANRLLALLSSLFNYAARQGVLKGGNPAAGIDRFPEDARERFVGPEELPYFFQALGHEVSDYRDVFLLALLTGARRSNVLAMQWGELNLERAEWRIPKTKHGGAHTVPLTAEAREILRGRERAMRERLVAEPKDAKEEQRNARLRQFVFPSVGETGHLVETKSGWRRILTRAELLRLLDMIGKEKGWSRKQIDKAFEDARSDEAGSLKAWGAQASRLGIDHNKVALDDLRVHDLRHTMGGALAATGANTALTMQALGHKTATASLIYQKLHRDPIREAMQRATGQLLGHAGVGVGNVRTMPRQKAK
jgi:integrase